MVQLAVLVVCLVVGAVLLARAFVAADPRVLARVVRRGALVLAVLVVGFLAVTGRLGPAMALGVVLIPLARYGRSLFGATLSGGFPFGGVRGTGGASGGRTSEVETVYLRMRLDHDTGAMDGEVLHGAFKGARLDALTVEQLLALLAEAGAGDPPSASVLEAWLDRAHPGWRAAGAGPAGGDGAEDGAFPAGGAMTAEEARAILGLAPGATAEQVKEAHRRLMMKVHPDHGGSTYLAAKINQAKDLLLRH